MAFNNDPSAKQSTLMRFKCNFRLAAFLLLFMLINFLPVFGDAVEYQTVKGVVLLVEQVALEEDPYIDSKYLVKVKLTSGPEKGAVFSFEHIISKSDSFQMHFKVKDKILVGIVENAEGIREYYAEDYQREGSLLWLFLVFVITIVWVGKGHGLKALATLAFTLIVVFYVLIPLMLKGISPLLATIGVSAIATTFTLLFLSGFSKKSLSAIIGTVAGVVVSAVIAYWMGESAYLTGLSNEEAVMLKFIPQGDIFDPRQLLYAGILLGTLGAAMDVAMSISSAIAEIHYHNPTLYRRKLMKSGMNVGRDVMGTMVDTLILAYLGTAMPLVLLFVANKMPLVKVLNMDMIATEIVRSLAGSIGIIASLPLTAAIAVLLHKPAKKQSKALVEQEAVE